MKKSLVLLATVITVAFYACGPSAEEKAKREQEVKDSIAKVEQEEAAKVAEQMRMDSIAKAEEAAKAAEQMRMDSIAKAEEASKGKKAAPAKAKTPEQKINNEAKKATGGRG
jgi:hypothetical protein